MAKIKNNSKAFYIVFGIIDVLLLLATVFLLGAALIFRGGSAPALFGHNVFLVDNNAFSTVKKGSALIVDKVEPKEIAPGNLIVFTDEEETNRLGEVQETASDDGVYTYTVKNDAGSNVAVGQSHIVGKGVYYSEFIGWIISFATSPAGVCFIAVLPCAAFVIFEIIGIIRRRAPQPEVDTVKKQYETPTYIPPAANAARFEEPEDEEEKPVFSERQRLMEAAGLFTPPTAKKPEPPKAEERAPISGRAIDQLIKETKAKHEREAFSSADIPEQRQPQSRQDISQAGRQAVATAAYRAALEERPAIELTDEDERPHSATAEKAEENVKQYVPSQRASVKLPPRVSRLDSLLKEESGDTEYDIDDILRSLEK